MPSDKSRLAESAIRNLLTASSIDQAATLTGIAPRTLRYWLSKPAFRERLSRCQRAATAHVVAKLADAASAAAEALANLLGSEDEAVRLKAAGMILDLALRRRAEDVGPSAESPQPGEDSPAPSMEEIIRQMRQRVEEWDRDAARRKK